MSSKRYNMDSDCDGDVDFDFFDTPKEPPASTFSPREQKSSATESKTSKADSASDESDSQASSGPVTRASVKKIEAKIPNVPTATSHDYSDSFESDSEHGESDTETHAPSPKFNSKSKGSRVSQKKAWEGSDRYKSASAKSQSHCRSTSNGKSKPLTKSRSHGKLEPRVISDESSDISTDSDSDSDVTEVSPLGSPKGRRRDMYDMHELAKLGKPPRSPMHKETVSYQKSKRPSSGKSKEGSKEGSKLDKLLNADSDTMDLQLLMQAVLEMEQDREQRQLKQRRVLFAPPPQAKPQAKLNQTFSNDKVRTIDRENQRLMKRIMDMAREAEAAKTKKKPKPAPKEPPKLTPSAVNRLNEQRRIERDNLAMLKRLQGTKATKDLQRDKLITNYNSTMIAGHSLAGVHQPSGKLHSPYESRSTTSLGGSEMGGGKRTRPGSAKSSASTTSMRSTRSAPTRRTRPQSGKRGGGAAGAVGGRPDWESGW